jgi:hypothetical protein
MKTIVSALVESPFYFTMPLRDRFGLVRRLMAKEERIDLRKYQTKKDKFLKPEDQSLSKFTPF